jgi:hypothetical protein
MPELLLAVILGWIPTLPIWDGAGPARSSVDRVLRLLPGVNAEQLIAATRVSRGAQEEPASWTSLGFRNDGRKLSHGRDLSLDVASVNSRVSLIGPDDHLPLRRTGWESEDSLKLPFNRTFFVVGKIGADSGSLEEQQYKLVGSTGLGVRLPFGGEVQMRRGRSMTNYDPDDLVLVPERYKDFVEFTTKWTLPGDVKLEYTQESVAPQTPLGRDKTKRDVRLAYPLPNSGQIHIGAKYESPDTTTPTPWVERTKIYLGLLLKR